MTGLERTRPIMYICVRGISFSPVSMILRLDFGHFLALSYFFFIFMIFRLDFGYVLALYFFYQQFIAIVIDVQYSCTIVNLVFSAIHLISCLAV